MAPKLVLDENLSASIAHRLPALGYDVTSLRDRGRLGEDDWDVDLLNELVSLDEP